MTTNATDYSALLARLRRRHPRMSGACGECEHCEASKAIAALSKQRDAVLALFNDDDAMDNGVDYLAYEIRAIYADAPTAQPEEMK